MVCMGLTYIRCFIYGTPIILGIFLKIVLGLYNLLLYILNMFAIIEMIKLRRMIDYENARCHRNQQRQAPDPR